MSWPTLPASSGIFAGSSRVPSCGKLDHAAVVVAVHQRLDARAGRVGAGVDVRDQADHGRVGDGRRQRRVDVAVLVELGVGEPDREQLVDQQPAQVELAGGAGRAFAVDARLGVDLDVALEALEQVGRHGFRQR